LDRHCRTHMCLSSPSSRSDPTGCISRSMGRSPGSSCSSTPSPHRNTVPGT
jgi:hypothetical protein